MFGVGLPELAVICLVAVLVFGPDKLPEFARQAGRLARTMRTFAHQARDELREELGPEYADLNLRDLIQSLAFPGLWKFMKAYPSRCSHELLQSLSKKRFCRSLQRLIPEITVADLAPGGAGVRAQAIAADGTLMQDFCFDHGPNALHLLNAPSPGATASLAIGEAVLEEIAVRRRRKR